MVFLLDLVIIVVGMVDYIEVMVIVVVIVVGFMMVFVNVIGCFIIEYLMLKMLVLLFLVLVGMVLIVDGLEFYIFKGYIYFVMVFSFGVEMFNLCICVNCKKVVG